MSKLDSQRLWQAALGELELQMTPRHVRYMAQGHARIAFEMNTV
jgi:hypothetical protein